MMSSCISTSSPSSSLLPYRTSPFLSPALPLSLAFPSLGNLKEGVKGRELLLLRVNCVNKEVESKPEATSRKSPSLSSSGADEEETSISSYRWCAVLGGIGFLETCYLTYLKLTGSDAFCPLGAASCASILNSDYSLLFGVPLPMIGVLAYGSVATLGLQLSANNKWFGTNKTDSQMILLGITTSMAAASAYFLYILTTEFSGESCLYCLTSALLSFSLFFITLKNLGSKETRELLGLQLCVASLVVIALSTSYNAQPVSQSLAETELPYFATEIKSESSPLALSLARHLRSTGARLYGAFWCTHCQEQKEMFGREAAKLLDYVECYPDGVKKGTTLAKACTEVKLEGFPTWVINGQVLSGEKNLSELAKASGIELEDLSPSK